MSWVEYWNGTPTIYVSKRHQEAHDMTIVEGLLPHIPRPSARVLDYGCGDATGADRVAERCGTLFLWDAAAAVRQRLQVRFQGNAGIAVLSPDAMAGLEDGSIDLITIVSVVQYLDDQAFSDLLSACRRLLSSDGKLIIADVIPPDVGIARDAEQLVRFGLRERFATAAVIGLARTALSGYVKLRSTLSLRKYREDEFAAILAAHGFSGRQLPRNIGHNQYRKSYIAVRGGDETITAHRAPGRTTEPA